MATTDPSRSLNGGKTKPLTPTGLAALRQLASGPCARAEFNPGVADRLTREPAPLAEPCEVRSPYKKDRGGMTRGLEITEAGRAALRAVKA